MNKTQTGGKHTTAIEETAELPLNTMLPTPRLKPNSITLINFISVFLLVYTNISLTANPSQSWCPGFSQDRPVHFSTRLSCVQAVCTTTDSCKCSTFVVCKIILQAHRDNAVCPQSVSTEFTDLQLMSKR